MSTQFNWRTSRFDPASLSGQEGVSGTAPSRADAEAFVGAVADLSAQLQADTFHWDIFLNQAAGDARRFTHADSTVIALREHGSIICCARSGSIGPSIGAPLDSRSGISGECLRRGVALRCDDSNTDTRVDAEVCRRLGIRSLVLVPIFDGPEVIGLLEAFSSRPSAFQDRHVSILEKLAAVIAEANAPLPVGQVKSVQPVPLMSLMPVQEPASEAASPPKPFVNWREAFQLRPYQIAIVASLLLLDLLTVYLWQHH